MGDFDPYYDYDEPCDEHVLQFAFLLRETLRLREEFTQKPSRARFKRFMQVQEATGEMADVVKSEALLVPVIVHEAGEKQQESNPDNPEQVGIFQRCRRCGSVLSFWHRDMGEIGDSGEVLRTEEEDMIWWTPGETVAKSGDGVLMRGAIGMYAIGDRELRKHEKLCANLSDLEGDENGEA